MGKITIMNKKIISVSIIIVVLLITIFTTYKVIKNHHNNLYKVVNDKIIESAKRCYYDEVCIEDKVTLEFLYQKEYLKDKLSDPVTKEYYNELSYVQKNNDSYEFFVVS